MQDMRFVALEAQGPMKRMSRFQVSGFGSVSNVLALLRFKYRSLDLHLSR